MSDSEETLAQHYLDYNATAPLRPEALEVMWPFLNRHHGNSQSVHRAGRLVRQAVEQAREQVAQLVGCQPAEVTFTSGATESDNWALAGLMPGCARLVGRSEHDAVLQAVPESERLEVDAGGQITAAALQGALADREPALLSIMWANNETGVVNDMPALAEVAARRGDLLHSDAVQAVGRVPVDFARSGLAAMSVSSHKIGGPLGVGALVVRRDVSIRAGQRGGGHENGRRAGTLNVPAIVGFGAAAELLRREWPTEAARLRGWRDAFEVELTRRFPEAEIFGRSVDRLPNTSFFALPGWHSEALLMALDKRGFALASGSACHSGTDVPSHVLTAMGIPPERALGAIRMSLGHASHEEELAALLDALVAIDGTRGTGGVFAELLNT